MNDMSFFIQPLVPSFYFGFSLILNTVADT